MKIQQEFEIQSISSIHDNDKNLNEATLKRALELKSAGNQVGASLAVSQKGVSEKSRNLAGTIEQTLRQSKITSSQENLSQPAADNQNKVT